MVSSIQSSKVTQHAFIHFNESRREGLHTCGNFSIAVTEQKDFIKWVVLSPNVRLYLFRGTVSNQ